MDAISSHVWSVFDTEPATGADNMAFDEALLESVCETRRPVIRFYRWRPACVSLGRNQPALGHYDGEALAAAGVDVVRRPTGGRAVLHDTELTYAVVAPVRLLGSPRRAYRKINEVLARGLASCGASAEIRLPEPGSRAPVPSTLPCFTEPVEGEVMAEGRKLIGSAQLCHKGVLLQHGSVPLRRSPVLDRLPAPLAAALDGDPAFLDAVRRSPTAWADLVEAILHAWDEHIGKIRRVELDPRLSRRADQLRVRYANREWTWRL